MKNTENHIILPSSIYRKGNPLLTRCWQRHSLLAGRRVVFLVCLHWFLPFYLQAGTDLPRERKTKCAFVHVSSFYFPFPFTAKLLVFTNLTWFHSLLEVASQSWQAIMNPPFSTSLCSLPFISVRFDTDCPLLPAIFLSQLFLIPPARLCLLHGWL